MEVIEGGPVNMEDRAAAIAARDDQIGQTSEKRKTAARVNMNDSRMSLRDTASEVPEVCEMPKDAPGPALRLAGRRRDREGYDLEPPAEIQR